MVLRRNDGQATQSTGLDREYDRIMQLIREKKIETDPRLVVVEIDGLLQFMRADFIPFIYCPGEIVEGYLKDWWGAK